MVTDPSLHYPFRELNRGRFKRKKSQQAKNIM